MVIMIDSAITSNQCVNSTTLLYQVLKDTILSTINNIRYTNKQTNIDRSNSHNTNHSPFIDICYYFNTSAPCHTSTQCPSHHCCSYCLSIQHSVMQCSEVDRLIGLIVDRLHSNYYTSATHPAPLPIPQPTNSIQSMNNDSVSSLPQTSTSTLSKQANLCDICNVHIPYGDINHHTGKKHMKKLIAFQSLQQTQQQQHNTPIQSCQPPDGTKISLFPSISLATNTTTTVDPSTIDSITLQSRHCSKCNVTCGTNEQLLVHMQSNKHHKRVEYLNGLIDWTCELCSVTTHNSSEKSQHLHSNKHVINQQVSYISKGTKNTDL